MITVQNEKEKFSKQAEKDWELFLLNRAEELAPGIVRFPKAAFRIPDSPTPGFSRMIRIRLYNLDTFSLDVRHSDMPFSKTRSLILLLLLEPC